MAQTKRKRRTKHRGTAAGTIEARGRTGRKPAAVAAGSTAAERRANRLDRPPSWRSAIYRGAFASVMLFALFQFIGPDTSIAQSALMSVLAMTIYVPLGYVMDRVVYNRRQKSKARA